MYPRYFRSKFFQRPTIVYLLLVSGKLTSAVGGMWFLEGFLRTFDLLARM